MHAFSDFKVMKCLLKLAKAMLMGLVTFFVENVQ